MQVTNVLSASVFSATAFGFFILTVVILLGRRESSAPGNLLLAAILASGTWFLVSGINIFDGSLDSLWPFLFETLRSVGWAAFLMLLLARGGPEGRLTLTSNLVVLVGGMAALLCFGLEIWTLAGGPSLLGPDGGFWTIYFGARLTLSVVGLALIDNVYRLGSASTRWQLRPLALALYGMFAYDIALYGFAMLFEQLSATLYLARGVVSVLFLPLIAISAARNPSWKMELAVSRRMAFQTLSVLLSSVYLLLLAFGGFLLTLIEGEWGSLLFILFVFGGGLLLVLLAMSSQVRARLKVLIAKNFFSYTYDYREEWQRFIAMVSGSPDQGTLAQRIVEALCTILQSPGGVLWTTDESGLYRPTARWRFRYFEGGRERADGNLVRFLKRTEWIVDLEDLRAGEGGYGDLSVPEWAADRRAWLVVPLIHRDRLQGFVVVERTMAPRRIDWEDRDLLKTVGRQAASYLAEQEAEQALGAARQFETFNQRFAFVMHDVKNIVSQLSLMVSNAKKHAHDPAFQQDMLETVKGSVDKMKLLLSRLSEQSDLGSRDVVDIDLCALLEALVTDQARGRPEGVLTFKADGRPAWATADKDQIGTALGHLLQNALEACAGTAQPQVEVRLNREEALARIEIADNGVGMTEDFIQQQLFSPFKSTKQGGFGVGAYECRKTVLEHGGRLEVDSRPGEGTRMTVYLPLSRRLLAQAELPVAT